MRPRLGKRGTVVAAVAAAAVAAGGPALAYVLVSSNSGTRDVTPDTLSTVTSPGAAAVAATTLRVSWTAPAAQVTGATYTVMRTTDNQIVCTVSTTSCDDPNTVVPGTTYQYSVQTILSGTNWVSSTQTVSVTSPDVFAVTAVGGGAIPQQTAGTSFTVNITAKKGSPLVTDTTYTGKATTYSGLASSPSGSAPTYSPTSGSVLTFTSGVATLTVTPKSRQTTSLTVSDSSFATGTSNSFAVTGAAPASVFWSLDSAGATNDCSSGSVIVGNGGSRVFYVAALDSLGNLAKQGASSSSVAITKGTGGGNAPNPTSLTIAANANPAVTGTATTLAIPNGSPADTTYTATLSTLTVNCIIKKN